jgi:hypothetical protein
LSRYRRPAIPFLAGLVLLIAAACGGGSATPVAGSAAPGATNAPATSATNANDPNSIVDNALNSTASVKSFHIKIEVNGTITKEALQSEFSDAGFPITGDVKLDGTTLEGDVDVANSAASLSFNVPALPMLGNQPITGSLIAVDQVLYYQVSMLGPKYSKMDLGSLASGLPVPVPTLPAAAASASMGMTDEFSAAMDQLKAMGFEATLVGVEQIGGKDANHINISVPIDALNQEIAAASPSPMVQLDSASIDFWIYKDNNQLAKFELKGASSQLGSIDLIVTITNYDAPVSISAPAASDISTAG